MALRLFRLGEFVVLSFRLLLQLLQFFKVFRIFFFLALGRCLLFPLLLFVSLWLQIIRCLVRRVLTPIIFLVLLSLELLSKQLILRLLALLFLLWSWLSILI